MSFDKIKVLHINYTTRGGAAKACLRLHQALSLSEKVESKVLVLEHALEGGEEVYDFTSFLYEKSNLINRIQLKIDRRLYANRFNKIKPTFLNPLESNQLLTSVYNVLEHPLLDWADIIHLHWIPRFVNIPHFFQRNTKPVVWTMHDLFPITGLHHYHSNIDKIKFKTIIEKRFLEIKNIYQKANLHLVALSKWLYDETLSAEILDKSAVHHIPNSLNLDTFRPLNIPLRNIFNWNHEDKIVLFVAASVNNVRKGGRDIIDFLNRKDCKDIKFKMVGKPNSNFNHPGVEQLGVIRDERLMNIVYNAADLFVIPSYEDNLPNTVLESLATGTPVVGYDTGGIRDMIQDYNGLLLKDKSSDDLYRGIRQALNMNFDTKYIRQKAVENYHPSVQASAYSTLYKRILTH